jgi:hypothetical protein
MITSVTMILLILMITSVTMILLILMITSVTMILFIQLVTIGSNDYICYNDSLHTIGSLDSNWLQ